ncbi:hypothetical protein QJQ45_027821 [Haematococcus lacustris]|nr:hypothetical protein QJQ45_027821 [Haematococcus lacustris]
MQKQLEALRKGWDAAGLVLGKVADAVAEEGAGLLASSKALKAYQLGHPVATCGPGDLWAIYTATSKKPGAIFKDVCIWFLDKRRLYESNKQTAKPRCFDTLLDQQRKSCQHMARLKHPGVVKVIEPLEETATQMVLVTEPIMGSLRNITSHFSSVPGAAAEVKQAVLSPLELKLGLVMLTDTLTFLGSDAGLAHCGLTPQVVLVTTDGSWKLAGFTFSVATDYASAAAAAAQPAWTYNDPFPPMWDELAKPSLPYSAPELVGGWGGAQSSLPSSALSPAADVFSLAALAYELLSGAGQLLLPVRNSLTEYKAAVLPAGLGGQQGLQAVLASAPPLLQEVLRGMLAPLPSSRPAPAAFTASPFFQEDLLLRALRFLDTLLQRETGQKLAFLKDLSQLWTQLDDRLLRLRVLPALIQELRHEALQPVALPLVLSMLPRVTPTHFASQLLPLLKPLMEGAQGELLGGLMAGSAVLAQLMTQEQVGSYLVPLFARALDGQAGPAVIEECCKALQDCIGTLDYTLLKAELVPRLHAACTRTTSGSVRVYTLTLMAKVVGRLDREEANKIIDTAAQVVAVDRSASTLVCTAGLVDALSKQWGAEVTAGRLLPLLCPLLVAPSLSSRQFAELLATTQPPRSASSSVQAVVASSSHKQDLADLLG